MSASTVATRPPRAAAMPVRRAWPRPRLAGRSMSRIRGITPGQAGHDPPGAVPGTIVDHDDLVPAEAGERADRGQRRADVGRLVVGDDHKADQFVWHAPALSHPGAVGGDIAEYDGYASTSPRATSRLAVSVPGGRVGHACIAASPGWLAQRGCPGCGRLLRPLELAKPGRAMPTGKGGPDSAAQPATPRFLSGHPRRRCSVKQHGGQGVQLHADVRHPERGTQPAGLPLVLLLLAQRRASPARVLRTRTTPRVVPGNNGHDPFQYGEFPAERDSLWNLLSSWRTPQ